jgi:hypothetical protein
VGKAIAMPGGLKYSTGMGTQDGRSGYSKFLSVITSAWFAWVARAVNLIIIAAVLAGFYYKSALLEKVGTAILLWVLVGFCVISALLFGLAIISARRIKQLGSSSSDQDGNP